MPHRLGIVVSAIRFALALALAAVLSPIIFASHTARATDTPATCFSASGYKCIANLNPDPVIYDGSRCHQNEGDSDCYTCQEEAGSHCIKFGTSVPGYSGLD